MITRKQKRARIKNFTKLRLKGAYSAIRYAADSKDVEITEECKDYLKDSSILLLNALEEWNIKA